MSLHFDEIVFIRAMRAIALAIAAFALLHIQAYLSFSNWIFAVAIGLLALLHSTGRVVVLVFSILVLMVLVPPAHLEAIGRWVLALRNGAAL